MNVKNFNGPPSLGVYRAAAAIPPVGAPSEATARAVWDLVAPLLPVQLKDVTTSMRRWLTNTECDAAELTAKRALLVAIDACVCAGRDRKAMYINTVFDALAKRWNQRFRDANAATSWDMKEDTVTNARRELVEAGVDLDRMWSAVRDGIRGLYTTKLIGGAGHARGHRVKLCRRSARYRAYEKIVRQDEIYRRPKERMRLLLAGQSTPPLKIRKRTVAERDYDVMSVGEPTKAVIEILQSARLFLNIAEVMKDARELKALVEAHPWPSVFKAWTKKAKLDHPDPKEFQKARKEFLKDRQNQTMRKEFLSLRGRRDTSVAVYREVKRARKHIDADGFLEIRTAYSKNRNRRFQARHIWPSEVSSKEDAERTLVAPAEERVGPVLGRRAIYAKHSPRGRWFTTHASGLDIERDDWEGWTDDFAEDRRPLVGVDASASMYQIVAIALGWREAEKLLSLKDEDFKKSIVSAMKRLAASGKYTAPLATDEQMRKGVGQIVNVSYGAGLGSVLKKLRDDEAKFGTNWGRKKNLENLLREGAKVDDAIRTVVRMRDEYLETAKALAAAAHRRDPFGGISFRDPFDGEPVRWHEPRWKHKVLSHGPTPLTIKSPVGERKGDEYEVNYFGTPRKRKGSVQNLVAPALIHALDASYASHFILKLHEIGVRDIVMVHDCFLVPSDAEPALYQARRAAAIPWFQGLRAFYDVFEDYVGDDPVHGLRVRRWREAWEIRKAACETGNDNWPDFKFKPETTYSLV